MTKLANTTKSSRKKKSQMHKQIASEITVYSWTET